MSIVPHHPVTIEYHVRHCGSAEAHFGAYAPGIEPAGGQARHLVRWKIVSTDIHTCYYDRRSDAWDYARLLARKARGVAVLHKMDGGEARRVSYVARP